MFVARAIASLVFVGTLFAVRAGFGADRRAFDRPRARLEVVVVDERGERVAARVHVSTTSRFGSAGESLGFALADDAPAVFRLDEREVRVVATKGPEWSLASREVRLEPRTPTRVVFALRREFTRAPYLSADLHVHTDASPDGTVPVEERMRAVAAEDLDRIVLTDHNRVTRAPGDPDSAIPGVEITTSSPEIGHFNAFPMDEAPAHRGLTGERLFDAVHAIPGAVVQINHPRLDDHIAYFELAERARARGEPGFSYGADLLEVWNGFDLARPDRVDALFSEWLALRARGVALVATGGSDSHAIALPTLGMPRTYVLPREGERLVEAIRRGAVFVSNGPHLDVRVRDARVGDVVRIDGTTRVALTVTVHAASHVDVTRGEIFVGTRRRATFRIPASERPLRYEAEHAIDVVPGDEIVVRVAGDEPMDDLAARPDVEPCAFTNPIRFLHSQPTLPPGPPRSNAEGPRRSRPR